MYKQSILGIVSVQICTLEYRVQIVVWAVLFFKSEQTWYCYVHWSPWLYRNSCDLRFKSLNTSCYDMSVAYNSKVCWSLKLGILKILIHVGEILAHISQTPTFTLQWGNWC